MTGEKEYSESAGKFETLLWSVAVMDMIGCKHYDTNLKPGNRILLIALAVFFMCASMLTPACAMRLPRHHQDQNLKNPCIIEITDPVGKIDLLSQCFNNEDLRQMCSCQWNIRVPENSAFDILIYRRPKFTSFSSDGKMSHFIDSEIEGKVDIFSGGIHVFGWDGEDNPGVFQGQSNSITVLFDGGVISNEQIVPGSQTLDVLDLVYSATVPGSAKGLCEETSNQKIWNGNVIIANRTLGSRATIECNGGFRPSQSNVDPICDVTNGTLAWSDWRGRCLPISCTEPTTIEHGVVGVNDFIGAEKEYYEFFKNMKGFKIDETKLDLTSVISVAEYSCEMPYVLEGDRWSVCGLNTDNTPTWTQFSSRRCVIPSCETPIVLEGVSGSLVHPSYPSFLEQSGQINCQWRLTTKPESVIDFKVIFLDLPECPGPSITFISTTHSRPGRVITTLTSNNNSNNSDSSDARKALSMTTSSLLVTYQQTPSCHVKGHRGFYLQYEIREYRRRIRRAASDLRGSPSNPIGGPKQDPVAASPAPKAVSVTSRPPNDDTTGEDNSDEPNDSWKIAVGVVVPIVVLGIILLIVYKIYRKKFPVRMIIGREFGKFRNPNYQRPQSGLSLVRDDADVRMSGIINSNEYNPEFQTSRYKISYDNRGFEGDGDDDDDVDYKNEEEKADHEFRKKKSWLFRNKEEKEDDTGTRTDSSETVVVENLDTPGGSNDETDGMKNGTHVTNADDNNEFSDDSDIEAMLQEQKLTPLPKRKERSGSDLSTSSSNSEETKYKAKSKDVEDSNTTKRESSAEKLETVSLPDEASDREGGFVGNMDILFKQQTVEEMRAEMKARARSLSIESPRRRSSSLNVDPTKSARRNSHNDVLSAGTDLLKFVQKQKITASVVGMYLSDRDRSIYCSTSSINSNPHLVTDLDDSLSSECEQQDCNVKIVVTNDKPDTDADKTHPETHSVVSQKSTPVIVIHDADAVEEQSNDSATNGATAEVTIENSKHTYVNVQFNTGKEPSIKTNDDQDVGSTDSTSGSFSSGANVEEEQPTNMSEQTYAMSVSSASTETNVPVEIKDQFDNEIKVVENMIKHVESHLSMDENFEVEGQGADEETANTTQSTCDETSPTANYENVNNSVTLPVDGESISNAQSNYNDPKNIESSRSLYSEEDIKSDSFNNDKPTGLDFRIVEDVDKPEIRRVDLSALDSSGLVDENLFEKVATVTLSSSPNLSRNEDRVDSKMSKNDGNDLEGVDGAVPGVHEWKATEGVETISAETDVNGSKKKIGYVISNDDDSHSASNSSSGSISEDNESENSSDDADKMASYSFQDSQHHTGFLGGEESDDNKDDSLEDATGGLSLDASRYASKPEKQVHVISKVEFSDTSSDSSDVLENDSKEKTTKDYSAGSKQPLKKIALDLNKNFDDDGSGDHSSGDDDVSSDEVNASEKNNNNNSNVSIPSEEVRNNHGKEGGYSFTVASSDSGSLQSLPQRGRSETDRSDVIDVYEEFSDDSIDDMLLRSSGHFENTDALDSNSNVTGQRTIGIDPNLKFSFDSSSAVKFRDESDDDDIDV